MSNIKEVKKGCDIVVTSSQKNPAVVATKNLARTLESDDVAL
jgi:hypothetical protein